MLMIFTRRTVFEVFWTVILFVAVKMVGFVSHRPWPYKRFRNQVMDKCPPAPCSTVRENYKQIAVGAVLWFKNSINEGSGPIGYVSNLPKARNFVEIFKSNDGLPLFGIHGPIIPLQ